MTCAVSLLGEGCGGDEKSGEYGCRDALHGILWEKVSKVMKCGFESMEKFQGEGNGGNGVSREMSATGVTRSTNPVMKWWWLGGLRLVLTILLRLRWLALG